MRQDSDEKRKTPRGGGTKNKEAKEGPPRIVGDWGEGGGCPPAALTCRVRPRVRRHRTCWRTTEAEEPVRETLCCAPVAVAWTQEGRGGGQGPLQRGEPRSVPGSFQPALTLTLTSFPRSPLGEHAAAAAAVSAATETDSLELGLCALKTIDRGQHKRRGFRLRDAHSRCSTKGQTLCKGPRGQRWVLMDGT